MYGMLVNNFQLGELNTVPTAGRVKEGPMKIFTQVLGYESPMTIREMGHLFKACSLKLLGHAFDSHWIPVSVSDTGFIRSLVRLD